MAKNSNTSEWGPLRKKAIGKIGSWFTILKTSGASSKSTIAKNSLFENCAEYLHDWATIWYSSLAGRHI